MMKDPFLKRWGQRRPVVGEPVELSSICPYCKHHMQQASEVAGVVGGPKSMPSAGDVTICMGCGEWAVFTGNGGELREPTDEEHIKFGKDKRMAAIRKAYDLATKEMKNASGDPKQK